MAEGRVRLIGTTLWSEGDPKHSMDVEMHLADYGRYVLWPLPPSPLSFLIIVFFKCVFVVLFLHTSVDIHCAFT